jgi:hypothetical protein
MRDYPVGFWPLNETSGSVAYDISGAGNHGTYEGSFIHNLPPLVPISGEGKLINPPTNYVTLSPLNDYTGKESEGFFGTYSTSDNPFSLEFWVSLNEVSSLDQCLIIRDSYVDPRFVIYVNRGHLAFGVYSSNNYSYYETKSYLNYSKKAIHVVAVYNVDSISLYVDGMLTQTTSLPNDFKFYGTPISDYPAVSLEINPDVKCIVNAVALYRYSLTNQTILSHYIDGNTQINLNQVAKKNNGKVFDLNAGKLYESFIYTYPADKPLQSFINSDNSNYIYYDLSNKSLKFYDTLTEGYDIVLEDFVIVPEGIGTTSKIEWRGDSNIKVETSDDGQTYEICDNGGVIPQYRRGSYSTTGFLYIKITMSSLKYGEVYSPEFSFLSIVFYKNKELYSDNGGGKIYFTGGSISSTADISYGTLNYPTLSRHNNNGVRCIDGFILSTIDISLKYQTIEMFFTPISLNKCTLVYAGYPFGPTSIYSWDTDGTISKTGISKIYVNGIEKAAETNISNVFSEGQMHHVVLVLDSKFGADCYINCNPNTLHSGPENLYNNIILYEDSLDGSEIQTNYKLWTGSPSVILVDPVITIDEKKIKIDNVDWLVVQSS